MSRVTNTTIPPRNSVLLTDTGVLTQPWSGWFRNLYNVLKPGITVTVALAKITPGGTNGSVTVINGIITAYTAPT